MTSRDRRAVSGTRGVALAVVSLRVVPWLAGQIERNREEAISDVGRLARMREEIAGAKALEDSAVAVRARMELLRRKTARRGPRGEAQADLRSRVEAAIAREIAAGPAPCAWRVCPTRRPPDRFEGPRSASRFRVTTAACCASWRRWPAIPAAVVARQASVIAASPRAPRPDRKSSTPRWWWAAGSPGGTRREGRPAGRDRGAAGRVGLLLAAPVISPIRCCRLARALPAPSRLPAEPTATSLERGLARPLFRRARKPARLAFDPDRAAGEVAMEPSAPRPQLSLSGIVWSPRPIAVLEGLPNITGSTVMRTGDSHRGRVGEADRTGERHAGRVRYHLGAEAEESMNQYGKLALATWLLAGLAQTPARAQAPVTTNGDSVRVRFLDTDLRAVIQAVGSHLPKPVIAGGVPEVKVSLETPEPVNRETLATLLAGLVRTPRPRVHRGLQLSSASVPRVPPLLRRPRSRRAAPRRRTCGSS